MSRKLTCRECVHSVLKAGGRYTNQQIRELIKARFDTDFYNNTICKYLSFMQKSGEVDSETITKGDKHFDEYWLVQQQRVLIFPLSDSTDSIIDQCIEMQDTYPDDHIEYKKIQIQIDQLSRKAKKIA